MIIDIHTHIFPKNIRKNREKYFNSEPAFKLLYDSPKAKLTGAKELVESLENQGVDRAVVFGFPWESHELFKAHNDYISNAVNQYPEKLTGFGCFDPCSSEAVPETLRCLKNGLSGIGELAFYQCGMDHTILKNLDPIMKICRNWDVPVMIHTNEPVGHNYPGKTPNTLKQIYDLAKRFPENRIVLAHWGGGIFFFSLLKKEVKDSLQNIYYDTAASPFLYDLDIYRTAINIIGADKILFGSDWPLLSPERYFKEFKKAGLSSLETEKICGVNAAKLLRI